MSTRPAEIVRMRDEEGKTFVAIAKHHKVSQERVRQEYHREKRQQARIEDGDPFVGLSVRAMKVLDAFAWIQYKVGIGTLNRAAVSSWLNDNTLREQLIQVRGCGRKIFNEISAFMCSEPLSAFAPVHKKPDRKQADQTGKNPLKPADAFYVRRLGLSMECVGLPVRAVNVCERLGLTTPSLIREAVLSGKLVPNKVRNYGLMAHASVCAFVGVDDPGFHWKQGMEPKAKLCPHCGKQI